MNATQLQDHAVQFYEEDGFLVNTVAQFAGDGLALGEPVIIVMSQAHASALVPELYARGVDVDRETTDGRLIMLDAREGLASFMDGDMPSTERFQAMAGSVLDRAATGGMHDRVRAFGEMVDLLWQDGKGRAAIRLEQLWNEVASTRNLTLSCAYSMDGFATAEHMTSIEEICGLHTHVHPTERFVDRDEPGQRMEIVVLQQRARALETELVRRKSLESNLQRASDAAIRGRAVSERTNRAKSQFLGIVGHELRTPLNAIGGYTELLEMGIHGSVSDEQRDALDRISRNQRHLLGLINEVLDYAKLETGSLRYSVGEVPMGEVLGTVESMALPLITAKGLHYTQTGADALAVLADRAKLQQIILNLLTNATKFTAQGGNVSVECTADETTVFLAVSDTGIGIPAERVASIFDPFLQPAENFTRTNEGIGLGLAISRELAAGMNGILTVESFVGQGSTFTLALPRSVR